MKGSIKLFTIFGISINIHITFFLLLLLVLPGGIRWVCLVIGVFFFVTMHELCHSLAAKRFGIKVREITLLPIGGVAAMSKMPEKPSQELLISHAGPLSNVVIIIVFYYPLKFLLGEAVLFHPLSAQTWPLTLAYVYWINLILAAFNMLPAFPMDGGRVLRAILANWLGYQKATRIAVNFGHIFALAFAYFGIIRFNIVLIVIAIFIYMAASNEELQVDVKETLKKFKVRDILPHDFLTLQRDTTLGKVLELVFHSHQEDFPVLDGPVMVGFITRQDIMTGMHRFGTDKAVREIMMKDFPRAKDTDPLIKIQNIMHEKSVRALPVMREDKVIGVVTIEDIGRIYAMTAQKV
ncbi:MAG: site-2 protease family protein [Candidatus Omnitrophota bacterium]|nr:site-2 protease family protein [Candidatus Omnitrophota bacterium]